MASHFKPFVIHMLYSEQTDHSVNEPFGDRTVFNHLNAKLVGYLDPHFMSLLKFVTLNLIQNVVLDQN